MNNTNDENSRTASEFGIPFGTKIENLYRIEGVLGAGAMGDVYRAKQLRVGREVAIKVLNHSAACHATIAKRFETEVDIVRRLAHPNTMTLIDTGRLEDGRLYVVSELLEGETLEESLSRGPLSVRQTIVLLKEVAGALAEAHAHGVVHRDLKPANIYMQNIRGDVIAKVLDFGVAKFEESSLRTTAGHLCGTPAYLSPEQALCHSLDGRSDLYSLGIVAYECLSGDLPFQATSALEMAVSRTTRPPKNLSEAWPSATEHPALHDLIMSMLSKDPEGRPKDAQTLLRLLDGIPISRHENRQILHTKATLADGPTDAGATVENSSQTRLLQEATNSKRPSLRRARLGLAAGGALVAILMLGTLLLSSRQPQAQKDGIRLEVSGHSAHPRSETKKSPPHKPAVRDNTDTGSKTVSDVLRNLELRGTVYFRAKFEPPWGMRIPSTEFANFHIVTEGKLILKWGERVIHLQKGDLVMFPHGSTHDLISDLNATVLPGPAIMSQIKVDGNGRGRYRGSHASPAEPTAELICGHFSLLRTRREPLFDHLPDLIVLPNKEIEKGDSNHFIPLAEELLKLQVRGRGGDQPVVDKLAEALLVETLGEYLFLNGLSLDLPQGALSTVLSDDIVGQVTKQVQQQPNKPWTTASLGQSVGLSEGALAKRFLSTYGISPMDYIHRVRMNKAWLYMEREKRSLQEAATLTGYRSKLALARAFKKQFGFSPH